LAIANNSRIYRLRGRRLDLLSEDHSLFNEFVRAGLADPERPEDFEQRNVITRAVGVEPTVEVDARLVEVAPGDTLLLCTDGLSGVLEHRELASILLAHTNLDEAVEHLIARANDHGGPDNITALLVRWESMNAAPRGTPVSVAA
jgi:protein phosphatase